MYKNLQAPNKRKPFSPEPSLQEYIFGIRPIEEALLAGRTLERLFIRKESRSPTINVICKHAREQRVPVLEVPEQKLNRLCPNQNHQGLVGLISAVTYTPLEDALMNLYEAGQTPLILILDGITDARNMGGLLRTAECMGCNLVLLPTEGTAPLGGDAMRTSAGAIVHLTFSRVFNLGSAVVYLKSSGITVLACTEKAKDDITALDLTGPLALILGAEDTGISSKLLALADLHGRVPLFGKIESLNVSVAGAMVLYEAQRQRLMNFEF